MRCQGMKSFLALLIYCVVFSILFVTLYPLYAEDGAPQSQNVAWPGLNSKTAHVVNAADQRQILSVYEDSQSHSEKFSPQRPKSPPDPIVQDCPHIPKPLLEYIRPGHSVPLSDHDKLLAMCKQTEIITLKDIFTETMVATLTKIGEGAFADVFGCQGDDWRKLAMKIIPVGGDFDYNEEEQPTLKSIQTEMVITLELSLLGSPERLEDNNIPHYTNSFMHADRVAYCRGRFPDFLLDAWEEYDFRKDSDNDAPDVFNESQLYIVYVLENSGMQLGSYVYHSFHEAISILRQISLAMAIAEESLQFEHRDMHRGNVLVRRTKEEFIYFRLDHKDYHIKSYGVRAAIVDYTLSRITQKESQCVSLQDVTQLPWLFKGKGDIQFDVYRDMRNATHSEWKKFTPYTNVLWINYLTVKTKIKGKLKGIHARMWESKFRPYTRSILRYKSAKEVFLNVFLPDKPNHTSSTVYVIQPKHHHV